MTSRMFSFITRTWNPLGGECKHKCSYCWARQLALRYGHKKYIGEPRLYKTKEDFVDGDFVFVCDMTDLFASNVPNELILQVLETIRSYPKTKFLLLTKNPQRYQDFINDFPHNVVLGATIESNIDFPNISRAPSQLDRLIAMKELRYLTKLPLFVCVEPILDFMASTFADQIIAIKPWAVAIGYDNYHNKLPEPLMVFTNNLVVYLEENGVLVYRKTIRKAWFEK